MTGEIIKAILTSSVFTGFVLELIKIGKSIYEKKKDKGRAKIDRVVTELASDVKQIKRDVECNEETERVLLHDRIWQIYYELKDRETITVEEDANLDYLYSEYEKKNGNHKAKAMYKFLKKKPVVADLAEEEEENDD